MKERNPTRVGRLLELTAAQPAAGIRQVALLSGLAGRPPSKGTKPGTVARPLRFPEAPPALVALAGSKDAKVQPFVTRVDQQLAWTGALIITLTVLALSIIARSLTGRREDK